MTKITEFLYLCFISSIMSNVEYAKKILHVCACLCMHIWECLLYICIWVSTCLYIFVYVSVNKCVFKKVSIET